MRESPVPGRSSALRPGPGGGTEDRGVGDLADGLIAQVLVEELPDAVVDLGPAEPAVAAVDDLDEGAGAPAFRSASASRSDWFNGTSGSSVPWRIRKGGSSRET